MVLTRARIRAEHVSEVICNFPEELWIEILSHLDGKSIGRAMCVSRGFAAVGDEVWKLACHRTWPVLAAQALPRPLSAWRRQYEVLGQREKELAALPSVEAIQRGQPVLKARHRTVLVEWLSEVGWEWSLESTSLFKAVQFLDHYLSVTPITETERFQLIGVAGLRAAMTDVAERFPVILDTQDRDLSPERFANMTDGAYTAEEVLSYTTIIATATPEVVKAGPNAKMLLRSYCFFLQLSLLDLECSAFMPSVLAAAALANALQLFGKDEWPQVLQLETSYTLPDLQPARARLQHLQSAIRARDLRQSWSTHHSQHGRDENKAEWTQAAMYLKGPFS